MAVLDLLLGRLLASDEAPEKQSAREI